MTGNPPDKNPPEKKPPEEKPEPDSRYWIAIIFVAGFFVTLAIALAYYWKSGSSAMATFVGTLFGGWMGTILGFYFGNKPAEKVQQQLKAQTERISQQNSTNWDEIWKRIDRVGLPATVGGASGTSGVPGAQPASGAPGAPADSGLAGSPAKEKEDASENREGEGE